MLTKALITGLPENDSNVYQVRIPLFEDTTNQEIIYDALYCYPPGIFGGLNIGDCVYVAFEDNKLNIPVILGKLYIDIHDDHAFAYINNLTVDNKATLPENTIFEQLISIRTLYDMMQKLASIEDPYSNIILPGTEIIIGSEPDSENNYYITGGYMSTNSTEIIIDVTLPDKLDNSVKVIECDSCSVFLRGTNGFIDSVNIQNFPDATHIINCSRASQNTIKLSMVKSGTPYRWSGTTTTVTNNSPINVTGIFKLKFS